MITRWVALPASNSGDVNINRLMTNWCGFSRWVEVPLSRHLTWQY